MANGENTALTTTNTLDPIFVLELSCLVIPLDVIVDDDMGEEADCISPYYCCARCRYGSLLPLQVSVGHLPLVTDIQRNVCSVSRIAWEPNYPWTTWMGPFMTSSYDHLKVIMQRRRVAR